MAVINWQTKVDPLAEAKKDKMSQLDRACAQTIMGTFDYQYTDGKTYSFYNDATAQANFDKLLNAFNGSMITSVPWTAYDSNGNVVRLTFDSATFIDLYKAHLNHIQSNIAKFRDELQPQVEAITVQDGNVQAAIDAVNAIVWV
jgi:hypothetical protein